MSKQNFGGDEYTKTRGTKRDKKSRNFSRDYQDREGRDQSRGYKDAIQRQRQRENESHEY